MSARVCVVGAGPRGTSVLERLGALRGGMDLEVHVVDPFPPGPGRIWRERQSSLLWMNSTVAGVAMFGPGVPSLGEWSGLPSTTFATRPQAGAYFSWVFGQAASRVPVVVHEDRVVDIVDGQVRLASGEAFEVDAVILAQGHIDPLPSQTELRYLEHARRCGLTYVPSGYASDVDGIPAGEPVIARGVGLTFVDYMVLLTEGRGGTFHRIPGGELEYQPSGREPVLYTGSRSGLPYHAKPGYRLAEPPPLPKFLDRDTVPGASLDFGRDLWPLVVKEGAWGYYHELFLAHPDRVRGQWNDFCAGFEKFDWGSPEMTALLAETGDRFDIDAVFEPLRWSGGDFQAFAEDFLVEVLDIRRNRDRSPLLGAIHGIGSALGVVHQLLAERRIAGASRVREIEQRFLPMTSFLTSGPPGQRAEEMLALARAGIVRFLGPGLEITPRADGFVAVTEAATVTARCLIEARLPPPGIGRADDPLVQALLARGECVEDTVGDWSSGQLGVRAGDHRLLRADGTPHSSTFAVGPCVAGFRAPISDGPAELDFFTQNDSVARAALAGLAT